MSGEGASRPKREDAHWTRRDAIRLAALTASWGVTRPSLAREPTAPTTEVRGSGGVPRFFLRGRPFAKPVFETYVPRVRDFEAFASAGTDTFSFSVNLGFGFGPSLWKGRGVYDFDALDALVERVREAAPSGMIMPRIHLSQLRSP